MDDYTPRQLASIKCSITGAQLGAAEEVGYISAIGWALLLGIETKWWIGLIAAFFVYWFCTRLYDKAYEQAWAEYDEFNAKFSEYD